MDWLDWLVVVMLLTHALLAFIDMRWWDILHPAGAALYIVGIRREQKKRRQRRVLS